MRASTTPSRNDFRMPVRRKGVSASSTRTAASSSRRCAWPAGSEVGQHLERQPEADRKPVLASQGAYEPQVLGTSPRILHGGDSQCRCSTQGVLESSGHLVFGRHRHEAIDELEGAFLQCAGRPSGSVPHDPTVWRVERVGRDPGQLERARVRPAGMAVEALEVGGPVGDHGVELLARGHAAREGGVEPAATRHPRLLWPGGRIRPDRLLHTIEPGDAEQVEPVEADGAIAQVHVGVVEARHHEPAGGVEDGGRRPRPFPRLALVPDPQDAAAADRHRGRGGVALDGGRA